jgi:hypothetical protein
MRVNACANASTQTGAPVHGREPCNSLQSCQRQAPDFWGLGSREIVISSVAKWSLQP